MTSNNLKPIGSLMLDVAGTELTYEDEQLLAQPEVGGVILFARNVATPEQVRKLTDSMRALNPNLLIAVDQEGGRVARLRQGFSPIPAMGKLGELFEQNPVLALALAYDCGVLMATEVLAVGVDFSFAPVLDVHGVSQVIGDRAFHQNPLAITALSAQFMRGMKSVGMATTGKHFPGHGSVAPDSHIASAIDERDFATILACDMQPFINNFSLLNALMPAHVIFSKVDNKPAGFSKIWLQHIIRQKFAFDGVLFSDDLSMKAAHIVGDAGERIKSALTAGCDMGLVCNDRKAALIALNCLQKNPKLIQAKSTERLAKMQADVKTWQGSLEKTAKLWQGWEMSAKRVQAQFF
ncbi:beta-hexosaminidase [Moraxella macacae 0408225]|uniref:Beta-hexosaminidase n=1 Tax=Moraxella macacae 0408225 TaxID=1230338 RepID=L2F9E3_9GAMM|nr:beta-N-acetylhexosaminidase [Moraxella macacae]ELA09684.1 beta-hexosaminidase [Moraxella macacae 0408225]